MPYDGEVLLTPAELTARGILPPGPLAPAIQPGNSPSANEAAIRQTVNPPPQPDAMARFKAAVVPREPPLGSKTLFGETDTPGRIVRAAGDTLIPGNMAELRRMLIPGIVGALVPGGATISRFLANMGANVAGQAAEGAYEGATDPNKTVLGGAAAGAAQGVLPGAVQGTLGALKGPSKATIQTQKAAGLVQKDTSPTVGAAIDPTKPASFFKRQTVSEMQKAAGKNLDAMEESVGGQLKDVRFTGEIPGVGRSKPSVTFEEIRAKIKNLREVSEKAYADPGSRETARKALAEASTLERDMIAEMPVKVAAEYMRATRQYGQDKQAIRFVTGQQKKQAITGGVNPFDRPELGKAEAALRPIAPSAAIHGAVGAAEAMGGRGLGAAYHLGRVSDALRSGYAGKVAEQAPLQAPSEGIKSASLVNALQNWLLRGREAPQPEP